MSIKKDVLKIAVDSYAQGGIDVIDTFKEVIIKIGERVYSTEEIIDLLNISKEQFLETAKETPINV